MKKRLFALLLALACLTTTALCACTDEGTTQNQAQTDNTKSSGDSVWYMGGFSVFSGNHDPETLFEGVADTVNPASVYSSVEFTEKMLVGAYTLNNKDNDIKKVREEIPFEERTFKSGTLNISILPVAVYIGAGNICSTETNYKYSEFADIEDKTVAVIEFATEDKVGQTPCVIEVAGNTITFKQIEQISGEGASLVWDYTGVEFVYEFKLQGPYLTFSKDGKSLTLKAYCLTENTDSSLSLTGYSLPDSPLIDELDYFASADAWNYAVRRDGSYYDVSAYKFDDEGRVTFYLAEKDLVTGETEKFVQQYAYIMQSSASSFMTDFSLVLLDASKAYYYTDDITMREARVLKEDGADVDAMTEDAIKEIAEKKSDLYDDLQKEFEAQGINVTINRSTGEIAMDASVVFGGDSSVVTDEGKSLLNKFLAAYTAIIYNDKYNGFISKTMVEGHTAPLAGSTYESGLPLSQERAENVKAYCLSSETGVDTSKLAETLEAVGLSNSKPVYNSDGEVDLDACRRVSFRFIVSIDE